MKLKIILSVINKKKLRLKKKRQISNIFSLDSTFYAINAPKLSFLLDPALLTAVGSSVLNRF